MRGGVRGGVGMGGGEEINGQTELCQFGFRFGTQKFNFFSLKKVFCKPLFYNYQYINPISTGGRCFPGKFCLPVDNFFSFGSIATIFGDVS